MTAPGQVASTAADQATTVLSTASNQASTVKDSAAGAASDVAGTAKQEVGNVVGETVTQAKDLAAQVKEQASTQLETQSSKALEQVRGMSSQLTSGDTSGLVGQLMTEAGQRLQSLTDYVERVGPEGVLEDVRRYARNNPGSFLLGAALAGLVGGRVMKGIKAGQSSGPTASTASTASTALEPTGTAAGDPLSGITEEGLGDSSGYLASPYPDSTYSAPYEPTSALPQETAPGGLL